MKLLEKLGITKAVLLGHSYGGRVIIKLAAREKLPFSIDRIVLIDSAGILPQKTPEQLKKQENYKRKKKFLTSPFIYRIFKKPIDKWASKQGSADYRAASPMMKQCMVKAVNEDLTPCLSKIRQEVLLIWGVNDTATPLKDGEKMEAEIPNAGLAKIQGAGHFCFLEQQGIFTRILQSYFGLTE